VTDLDRRSFLKTGAAVAAGTAVAGGPFAGYLAAPAVAGAGRDRQNALRNIPDLRDGVVRLALPEGFQYRSFQQSRRGGSGPNVTLDDGAKLPGRHDGMAAFAGPGDLVTLVRNHEENGSAVDGAARGDDTPVYDTSALGGTSSVHVTLDGQVQHSFMSLGGTQMNCSGGRMPWGSWITCEETVNGYDVGDDFTRNNAGSPPGDVQKPAGSDPFEYFQNARLQKIHGFIFEVPSDGPASGQPIKNAGRFAHEAVAFDPKGGSLYLTEDNFAFPSGFYRYDPPSDPMATGRLADGGTLWMLKVKGTPNADLAKSQPAGATFAVEWVQIDTPWFDFGRPPGSVALHSNDEAITFVGDQGRAKGAAGFSRLEGAVYDHGWVYWTATQGGGAAMTVPFDQVSGWGKGNGQIWGLDLKNQTLHMLYESPGPEILDFPDNVTTSARGTLVVCEDGTNLNFLRGLTRKGELFDIAQNKIATQLNDEFAGATFSPDGETLFVNIQSTVGLSIAIWGPWGRVGV
jgi:secreted PhoX family phosphatase